MYKLMTFLIGFISLMSCNTKSHEIAAIEHDGRFISIDLETFEITNVGDLKRFGFIYTYSAIAGSTFESAVILGDIASNQPNSEGLMQQHSWVKLKRLNEKKSNIPKEHILSHSEGYLRWISNDQRNRLAFMQHNNLGSLIIYDKNLQAIDHQSVKLPFRMDHITNCLDKNDNIIVANWYHKVTYPLQNSKTRFTSEKLNNQSDEEFYLGGVNDGCYSLMTSTVIKTRPNTLKRRIINIQTNQAMKIFTTRRDADFKLYNNGQLLLVHHTTATPIDGGSGVIISPTEDFILYNTHTGEIVKQFKIPNQNATLKKVIKTESGYIAILGGPKNIQFVSLETYKSLKTIKLPFKRFFVI